MSAAGSGRLTETGLSLGTPHYMSPEQATADRDPEARSDVYSLGCVLYEMLIGEPPFTGATAQAVLGKIVAGEVPEIVTQRAAVPAHVDATVRRALEKLPADRFTGAQEFARALADPGFRHGEEVAAPALVTPGPGKWLFWAGWASAAALAILTLWNLQSSSPSRPIARFESPLEEGLRIDVPGAPFDLSRDGSMLVFRPSEATDEDGRLWVRRWYNTEATPLSGTESAAFPSFSPDGDQIAFWQAGAVAVASLTGGPVQAVLPTAASTVHWGADGDLYVIGGFDGQLTRVQASGWIPEVIDALPMPGVYRVTDVLPGNEWLLLQVGGGARPDSTFALNVETAERVDITLGRQARHAPEGHLTFIRDNTLMVQPFDAGRLTLTGAAVSLVQNVGSYSLSQTGDAFYVTGALRDEDPWELVWATPAGDFSPAGWEFDRGGSQVAWKLSPDGNRVALRHVRSGNADIWVKELPDGPPVRLTFDESEDQIPEWMPDGVHLSFFTRGNLWSVSADGTGEPTLILDDARPLRQASWAPDGETVVLRVAGAVISPLRDLLVFRPGVDEVASPLVASEEFAENDPALSPDGRWLAYTTNETGQDEVWVRPFPDVESGKTRVSTAGGAQPEWVPGSLELIYIAAGPPTMISARIDTVGGIARVAGRDTLFELPAGMGAAGQDHYDVAADGQRFLMARAIESALDSQPRAAVLVQNFFEEVRRAIGN